jgi:hypothetical protein
LTYFNGLGQNRLGAALIAVDHGQSSKYNAA